MISVLLPTYARNKTGLLHKAIESVLQQDVKEFELYIVDDGSIDGTEETVKKYQELDNRIKHVRFNKNVGLPAYTTAKAFQQCKGTHIAWQFDDCVWSPDHLSTLLETQHTNKHCGIVYAQAQVELKNEKINFGAPYDKERLKNTANFIPNCSTLIKRSVYEQIGWHDPHILLKRCNDYDFWLRASKFTEFAFCEKPISVEKGQLLQDSLGNSVSIIPDIVQKYIQTERNDLLHISNFANWNLYTPPSGLSEVESKDFAYIVFEHFLRVNDLNAAIGKMYSLIEPTNYTPALETPTEYEKNLELLEMFKWYTHETKKRSASELTEKDMYIQEMRRFIDKQQAYIDEMQIYLNKSSIKNYITNFYRKWRT